MKICLLTNARAATQAAEGQNNIALALAEGLRECHEVLHLNAQRALTSIRRLKEIREFRPDIVHLLLRPTPLTWFGLCALRVLLERPSRLVASALQPPLGGRTFEVVDVLARPDLVLCLGEQTERYMRGRGHETTLFPVGVDSSRFRPVNQARRLGLRRRYGISPAAFVVLQVGHLTKGRLLGPPRGGTELDGVEFVVLASPAFKAEPALREELEDKGCLIIASHQRAVEELYQLADCYHFPTRDPSSCIELPLSILEAMACNLPVITTRFGAVPRIFPEVEGLFFVEHETGFFDVVRALREGGSAIQTRRAVAQRTWNAAVAEIGEIYLSLG